MKRFFPVFFLFFLFWGSSPIYAAVVHLNSGGSLTGRIQSMDDQTLSLESDRGFGVLQIDRADIRLIEFDGHSRNLARKFGFGYYAKAPIADEVNISTVSIKYWLSSTTAVDWHFGFGSTVDDSDTIEETLSLELRLTDVLLQEGNQDIYWGGGFGLINTDSQVKGIDDTGFVARILLGIEFFFITIPNLGISAEVGIENQVIGSRRTFGVFNSGFPTMAIRYYF